MKHTLHLAPINGGPFNCMPARSVELNADKILANNVVFAGEYNPNNSRLFVIGHEFGAVGAVWADCEQDAFHELIDWGLGDCFLIEESEADEETLRLGNAGEPCNLDYAWIQTVDFQPARDWRLMVAFAEARGAAQTTLDR